MTATTRVAPEPTRLGAMLILLATLGCQPADPSARAGVTMTPPSGWTRWTEAPPRVPGRPLAAWRGPAGSSLVVYEVLPAPGEGVEPAGVDLANRLANLPGVASLSRSAAMVDGRPATRVEVVAPGDGATLAPSGLGVARLPGGGKAVATRRVAVAVAGPEATVWLVWHLPEADRATLIPQVERMLATARVQAPIATRSSARKSSY